MESMQEIGMKNVSISYFYRAEEGQRGAGRWPPQARDTGRGMRSRVEGNRRPPERSEGCVCGIEPQVQGVRTQSRRHLNAVKVETGRGKGAKRLAGPKLRIDRGGMGGGDIDGDGYTGDDGGGGSIPYYKYIDWTHGIGDKDHVGMDDELYRNFITTQRKEVFHYCVIGNKIYNTFSKDYPLGNADIMKAGFPRWGCKIAIAGGDISGPIQMAKVFMHELGHSIGLLHTEDSDGSDPDPNVNPTGSETVKSSVMYWAALSANRIDYLYDEWDISDGDGIDLGYGISGTSSLP